MIVCDTEFISAPSLRLSFCHSNSALKSVVTQIGGLLEPNSKAHNAQVLELALVGPELAFSFWRLIACSHTPDRQMPVRPYKSVECDDGERNEKSFAHKCSPIDEKVLVLELVSDS